MMPFAEQRAQDPRMLHYVESLRKIQRKIGERLFARCQASMERTAQDAIKLQLRGCSKHAEMENTERRHPRCSRFLSLLSRTVINDQCHDKAYKIHSAANPGKVHTYGALSAILFYSIFMLLERLFLNDRAKDLTAVEASINLYRSNHARSSQIKSRAI